ADRLARGIIGQAKHDHIGAVDDLLARRCFLPQRGIDRDQLDVPASCEPLQDLQACRAGFAVDEDFRCHGLTHPGFPGALITQDEKLSHSVLQNYGRVFEYPSTRSYRPANNFGTRPSIRSSALQITSAPATSRMETGSPNTR